MSHRPQRQTVVVKSAVWRASLLPARTLGPAWDVAGADLPSGVGLVALRSAQVVTLWAVWRRCPPAAGRGAVGGGSAAASRRPALGLSLMARSVGYHGGRALYVRVRDWKRVASWVEIVCRTRDIPCVSALD